MVRVNGMCHCSLRVWTNLDWPFRLGFTLNGNCERSLKGLAWACYDLYLKCLITLSNIVIIDQYLRTLKLYNKRYRRKSDHCRYRLKVCTSCKEDWGKLNFIGGKMLWLLYQWLIVQECCNWPAHHLQWNHQVEHRQKQNWSSLVWNLAQIH